MECNIDYERMNKNSPYNLVMRILAAVKCRKSIPSMGIRLADLERLLSSGECGRIARDIKNNKMEVDVCMLQDYLGYQPRWNKHVMKASLDTLLIFYKIHPLHSDELKVTLECIAEYDWLLAGDYISDYSYDKYLTLIDKIIKELYKGRFGSLDISYLGERKDMVQSTILGYLNLHDTNMDRHMSKACNLVECFKYVDKQKLIEECVKLDMNYLIANITTRYNDVPDLVLEYGLHKYLNEYEGLIEEFRYYAGDHIELSAYERFIGDMLE